MADSSNKRKLDDPEVERCVAAFTAGRPVMVFDSVFREGETDLLYPACHATPDVIRKLRKECGGLLFLAIGHEVGEMYGLPYLQDLHTTDAAMAQFPVLRVLQTNDLQYDTRSAFTLSLNHRKTFTGITDKDRALTTRRFGNLTKELLAATKTKSAASSSTEEEATETVKASATTAMQAFGAEFRTPGHIPLCRESPGGLATRQGHTELAVAIARLAGCTPCTIGAEMLQPDGDGALSVPAAKAYAKEHNIPMICGDQLLRALGLPVFEVHQAKKRMRTASEEGAGKPGAICA